MHSDQQVENVARALYFAQNDQPDWKEEPEFVKRQFRRFAQDVIALLKEQDLEEKDLAA
jgi:hypothetical protein